MTGTPPDENWYKNPRNLRKYPQERMSPKPTTRNVLLFSSIALSSGLLSLGQVGPDSKAGLAWPNGRWADIQQYTTTGKVSWCVYVSYTSCQARNKLRTLTGTILGARILWTLPLNTFPCYGVSGTLKSGQSPLMKRSVLERSLMLLASTSELIQSCYLWHASPSVA